MSGSPSEKNKNEKNAHMEKVTACRHCVCVCVCRVSGGHNVAYDDDGCDETGDQLRWNDSRHHWKSRLEHRRAQLHAGLQELYACFISIINVVSVKTTPVSV